MAEISFESTGEGPPLLLIHSLGTGRWMWREQVRHWRASHRVVAADCRGHGGTPLRGGATMEANADDLAALAEELDLRGLVVVGLSMGGTIAAHLHARIPDRIRGMVLAGAFCRVPSGAERVAAMEQRLGGEDMQSFARSYAQETLLAPTAAAHAGELADSIARTGKAAYLQTMRSLYLQDARPLVAAVRCPILVLLGGQDRRTPLPLSEEIVATAPHARLEILPDAAHLSNLDNPAGFERAVDGFIRGLGSC